MDDADLVKLIYASVVSDEAFSRLLAVLAARFGCGSSALFYLDPRRPEADIKLAYGVFADPEVQKLYFREFASIDPAPSALARLRIGQVATTDQLFSASELRLYTKFIEGFYHPVGLGGALGGPLANQNGQLGMVAVHRGLARAPFDDADIASFQALMPHLAQAIELRRAFFEITSQAEDLARALEPVSIGILSLRFDSTLQHANLAARRILARDDALWLDARGALRAKDAQADTRLRIAFAQDRPDLPTSVLRIPGSANETAFVLRIVPRSYGRHARRGWTVLVSDPAGTLPEGANLLVTAFGMTRSSAELTMGLVRGATLQNYAAKKGISVNTAKFHLKGAFASTGVNRQSELVRLCFGLVRDLVQFAQETRHTPPLPRAES